MKFFGLLLLIVFFLGAILIYFFSIKIQSSPLIKIVEFNLSEQSFIGSCSNTCRSDNECLSDEYCDRDCCKKLCEPLFINHNNRSSNRINFVFEGIKYENVSELLRITRNFIDFNSTNLTPGLFGQEPFKSNSNLFNFWYISDINYCDSTSDPACEAIARRNYYACNVTRPYYFRFFHWSSTPWLPYIVNSSWWWAFTPEPFENIPQINTRFYLVHEFGHVFPQQILPPHTPVLLDEYRGLWQYPNYEYILQNGPWANLTFPNVYLYNNMTTISECLNNSSWVDLVGDGCGQDDVVDCILNYTPPNRTSHTHDSIVCVAGTNCWKEVACFEGGFGFTIGAYRPTYNSIMNNRGAPFGTLREGYNLPSQRHLCRVIKNELDTCTGICNTLIGCNY